METSEIITGLKDLIHDRESFITPDNDKFYGEDNPFRHDKAVLQAAINELTRRAEPGNKPLMTEEQRHAYKWALSQNYQSIAARNAKSLAEFIKGGKGKYV